MFVDDAPLKYVRASWKFCRGIRQPAAQAARIVSGARQRPATIVENAKMLGYLFARLAGSSYAPNAIFLYAAALPGAGMWKEKSNSADVQRIKVNITGFI
jgi:hypothetical protein